jgi:mRNA-degrading endonuclease RelE of RelBE toxin-antitoxin system
MKKPVKIILEENAKESFNKLNKNVAEQIKKGIKTSFEIQLLKSIKDKFEILRTNPFYGNQIKKRSIPKKIKESNIWRIELSNFWRMIYTLQGDEIRVTCFVLEIFNHKKYNKLFGYKNK